MCWQLRGQAEKRQVPGAKVALQHNLGLGGAVVIAIYRMGFPNAVKGSNGPRSYVSMSHSGATETLKAEAVFEEIGKNIAKEGPALVKKVKGSYLFKIKGSDGNVQEWLLDLKSGEGSLKKGTGFKGDCNITMKDSDFMDLVLGKIGAQKAFFSGKLKISGNTALAMKLQSVIPKTPKAKL